MARYGGEEFVAVFPKVDSEKVKNVMEIIKNTFKENTLYFTAPYTDTDLTAANGAGLISVDGNITGLIAI